MRGLKLIGRRMRMAPLERSDVLDCLHDDVFGVHLAPVHADVLRQDGVLRIHFHHPMEIGPIYHEQSFIGSNQTHLYKLSYLMC